MAIAKSQKRQSNEKLSPLSNVNRERNPELDQNANVIIALHNTCI